MAFVKIEDGIVVQKQPYDQVGFIEVGEGVYCGMVFDGETFSNPEIPLNKPAILAAYRYERETEGITVNGAEIRTDRETQAMLLGARTRAKENPDLTMSWKAVNGFVELAAPQIVAIADAVADHVQKCFTCESLVDLAECETEDDITAAFDAAYGG